MDRLRHLGLKVRESHQEVACYLEEFSVDHLDEIERLKKWPIGEVTLIQVNENWTGDFYLLAGRHHGLYQQNPGMEGYLSLRHPWQLPTELSITRHQITALAWVGFRETHGFIRIRLTPIEIISPGEIRGEKETSSWISERVQAFSTAIEVLDLPLLIEYQNQRLSILTEGKGEAVSHSWPDAFGPCQFEYIHADHYAVLVPAALLCAKLGVQPAVVLTYLSGFSQTTLKAFHQLQPEARLIYRGYVHAAMDDLPQLVQAVERNKGRIIVTLCEFETEKVLVEGEKSAAVIGVIGDETGYKFELRFNRAPLSKEKMDGWLSELMNLSVVYAPLPVC